jgi:hypothetical protein
VRQVLEGLASGQFSWHLILLIVLVFFATPILKHMLFKRGRRGGSVYQPPRKPEWTPGQARQARRLLAERRRKKAQEPSREG